MANQQLGFDVVGKSNASEVMGKAGKEADKLANKLKQAFDIKGALAGAFIGAFGAAALLDKAISTVTDSFKEMADVADQAGKAGITAAEFDKLAFAAQDAGVSTSVLSKSIRELRFFMKDALNDTNKMEQLTKNLGFAEEDVRSGKVKSIDIFNRVAQAIGTQTNDTQKLAIATAFFGDKVANDMLPVLETIAKNPDIFKGLVTGTEEAYKKIDELDTRFQKFWHNVKRSIAGAMTEQDQFYANAEKAGLTKDQATRLRSSMGIGGDISIFSAMNQNDAVNSAFGKSNAPATSQVSKAQADAIAASTQKNIKGDNTIANSLGASMGNGPTSGVIGVGNNATFTLMEEQLTTLKGIKDGIDRLAPATTQTDFTKQDTITSD
jgi:hypothetical protein